MSVKGTIDQEEMIEEMIVIEIETDIEEIDTQDHLKKEDNTKIEGIDIELTLN